jgi:hypothetical protein
MILPSNSHLALLSRGSFQRLKEMHCLCGRQICHEQVHLTRRATVSDPKLTGILGMGLEWILVDSCFAKYSYSYR